MQHCVLILSLFHYKHLAAKREKTRFLCSYQVSYLLLCIKTKWCDPLQAAEQKKLFFWHSNIQENSKSGTVCVTAESRVLVSHRLLLCALWQNTVHRWTKTEEGKGHTCVWAIRPVYTLYVLLWPHPSQLTSPLHSPSTPHWGTED